MAKSVSKQPAARVVTAEQAAFAARAQSAIEATAGRNPGPVLKTFYPPSLDIAGLKISKCGLGILGILEDIQHPFIESAINGKDVPVTIRDIQRALYIFAHPREAKSAISTGKLDETVEAWVLDHEIPADAATKAPFILVNMIRGGMGMAPGFDPEAEPAAPSKEGEAAGPLEPTPPPATPA